MGGNRRTLRKVTRYQTQVISARSECTTCIYISVKATYIIDFQSQKNLNYKIDVKFMWFTDFEYKWEHFYFSRNHLILVVCIVDQEPLFHSVSSTRQSLNVSWNLIWPDTETLHSTSLDTKHKVRVHIKLWNFLSLRIS